MKHYPQKFYIKIAEEGFSARGCWYTEERQLANIRFLVHYEKATASTGYYVVEAPQEHAGKYIREKHALTI
jgi:hypothetical protein